MRAVQTVGVTIVNQPPNIVRLASATIAETASVGTLIGNSVFSILRDSKEPSTFLIERMVAVGQVVVQLDVRVLLPPHQALRFLFEIMLCI